MTIIHLLKGVGKKRLEGRRVSDGESKNLTHEERYYKEVGVGPWVSNQDLLRQSLFILAVSRGRAKVVTTGPL